MKMPTTTIHDAVIRIESEIARLSAQRHPNIADAVECDLQRIGMVTALDILRDTQRQADRSARAEAFAAAAAHFDTQASGASQGASMCDPPESTSYGVQALVYERAADWCRKQAEAALADENVVAPRTAQELEDVIMNAVNTALLPYISVTESHGDSAKRRSFDFWLENRARFVVTLEVVHEGQPK